MKDAVGYLILGMLAGLALGVILIIIVGIVGCSHCTPVTDRREVVSAREAKNMKALGMDVHCLEDK